MPDLNQLDADVSSHHIEGKIDNEYVKIPLISHIHANLWTGGHLDVILPEDFRYVVSLYRWGKYKLPERCSRIEVTMYDAAKIPDEPLLFSLGELVADLCAKGKTLVHCQAGLNRSGLIGALALGAMTDMTYKDAIALLREKRHSLVLCNSTFEQWLLDQDDKG